MSLRPKKARQSKSKVKVMLITFFDVRGIVHSEFGVLATGPDDQSASLQRDPAAFASLSAREERRVAAGQIMAASPRQCTCSQRPEHPAVPGREQHRRTGTTSLFT